jgi:imidazolonepropionase-like amidohydrolase
MNKPISLILLFSIFTLPSFAQNFGPRVQPFIKTQAPVIAFQNALLIDGTGAPAQTAQTVIIRNGLIDEIGPGDEVSIPENAEVIDMSGKTLLPGFVMVHEHMFYPAQAKTMSHMNQMDFSFPKLYLAGGATTIRTAGSVEPYSDQNLKKWIEKGEILGPKMDITGPYINSSDQTNLSVMKVTEGPEEARKMVNYWADEGFTSFKVYQDISRDILRAVVEEVHARNLKVTGHICSISFREAADIGIDNLEHGFIMASDFIKDRELDVCQNRQRQQALIDLAVDAPEMKALISHLVEKGVAVTSTLPVFETFAKGQPVIEQRALDAMNPTMRDIYLTTWAAVQSSDDMTWAQLLEKEMAWEKAFFEAGGLLMNGTDPTGYGGVVAGFANIRAVELLVQAGFSLEDAVKVSTLHGAKYLEQESQIGTIAVGKKADLVVIGGDPTQNLKEMRKVEMVFKDGVGYDSEKVFEFTKGSVGVH